MTDRPPATVEWSISSPTFASDELHPLMRVYPWVGHRGFAYDLVRFASPRRLVELGVHWGTSYFAFLQAVHDGSIACECVGVDTWRGDGHTGPYGEDVFQNVTKTINRFFVDQQTRLLRMTFDEALEQIEDSSADLIHIDGFHTYEAVEHDFETWLPKLAENGVMLFHDTADSTGYGSARFWNELSRRYPSFSFTHSWGLGVLFPRGDALLRRMLAQNIGDKARIYEYRARYELTSVERDDLSKMAVTRLDAINQQSKMISDRDTIIRNLQGEVGAARSLAEQRLGAIQQQSEMIAARDTEIAKHRENQATLNERTAALKRETEARREAEETLRRRLDEIHQSLKSLATMRAEHESVRQRLADAQREREAILGEVRSLALDAKARAEENTRLKARVAELEAHAGDLAGQLQGRSDELAREQTAHADARDLVAAISRDLDEARRELAAQCDAHQARIAIIESLRRTIEEKDAMIEELRALTGRLNTDVELLELRTERLEKIIAIAAQDRGGPWSRALATLRGRHTGNGLATAVRTTAESYRKA